VPWQREFLRIDIEHLAEQFPYPLAPFYLELMEPATNDEIQKAFVKSSSDKEEMLLLPLRALKKEGASEMIRDFPVPFYTTVIPPGRHLGYVFEWAAMAGMTLLICVVLQLRRPKAARESA
jgi:cytochrome oxidase assembly protein ShyY1